MLNSNGLLSRAPLTGRGCCGGVAVLLSLLVVTSGRAHAQGSRDFSIERFSAASDRNGMLSVEWAGVPQRGGWELGVLFAIVDDPLLVVLTDAENQRIGALVHRRLGGALMASWVVCQCLQIGLMMPFTGSQSQERGVGIGASMSRSNPGMTSDLTDPALMNPYLRSAGLGDIRVTPKMSLIDDPKRGVTLAFLPVFTLPTSSRDGYLGERFSTITPTIDIARPRPPAPRRQPGLCDAPAGGVR